MSNILDYFPLTIPRERQIKALEFIEKAYNAGFSDIVIAAPTGIGKSAIGVTSAYWAASTHPKYENVVNGAYYLVTQKLLQDQLEADTKMYNPGFDDGILLKGSEEYPCPAKGNCGTGGRTKCSYRQSGDCAYRKQKSLFMAATLGITNYSYYLSETEYSGELLPRQIAVFDECHTIESVLLNHVEASVDTNELKQWLDLEDFPEINSLADYQAYLADYVPQLQELYKNLVELSDLDNEQSKELTDLDKRICKLNRATELIKENPKNWIYWSEESRDATNIRHIARPLDAAPFTDELNKAAKIRIYMSAYPGVKEIFCRSLGLNTKKVAWASLKSTFQVIKRPIVVLPMGSMGSKTKTETVPNVFKAVSKLIKRHDGERGLIHCASYELGENLVQYFSKTPYAAKFIIPKNADEREEAVKKLIATEGSILVSPSIVEGFDFKYDAARWQIILKCLYPYLGDQQVNAKMLLDRDWYLQRTVSSMLQASGRIVRAEDDYGITYVLDSDFLSLWQKASYMFPKWYSDALIFK